MPRLSASESTTRTVLPTAALQDIHLLVELVKRDFRVRFTGSALGVAWAVLQPLTLVVLYWFVFTFMIPRRPTATEGNYALFLISGLLPWIGISEGIMRGTTSLVDNGPMVRRLLLRSELLVIVPNITAVLFELIGLGLFGIFLISKGSSLAGLWVLPFAIGIQLLLQVGVAWVLSAVYVLFRDVMQILGFVLSIVFYLSPILYPVEGRFEKFFFWNPMTPLLGLFRSAMLSAPLPAFASIVLVVAVTCAVFLGGLIFFRRARPNIADLI